MALEGLRVLDCADLTGALCGKLLADMGADVVKVEPPGGEPTRRIGPFLDDRPHPDRSLTFWYYNTSKRGVTCALDLPLGQDLFRRLAASADVVIETFAPGTLESCGLGWNRLHADNPRLVLVSITPFGQTGPARDLPSSDLVGQAGGGMVYVNGHPGEPPLQGWGLQAYHSASAYGAIGVLLAVLARERTGLGQWVDVSVQESVVAAVEHASGFFHQHGAIEERRGTLHWSRGFRVSKCRDGDVMHCLLGDWTSLIEWVKADGAAQDLGASEWEDFFYRRDHAEHVFDVLDAWAKKYTVRELTEGMQLRRLPYAAVRSIDALVDDPQLAERGFFVPIFHPETGQTIRYPGAPYQFSATPWGIRRRPPLMGEHNRDVYVGELGLERTELEVLMGEGVV